jgi:hypothetical protein
MPFETPMAEVASPRNMLIGHGVGALVAYFWLNVFGLVGEPSARCAGPRLDEGPLSVPPGPASYSVAAERKPAATFRVWKDGSHTRREVFHG